MLKLLPRLSLLAAAPVPCTRAQVELTSLLVTGQSLGRAELSALELINHAEEVAARDAARDAAREDAARAATRHRQAALPRRGEAPEGASSKSDDDEDDDQESDE
jgi:hypothetical protein